MSVQCIIGLILSKICLIIAPDKRSNQKLNSVIFAPKHTLRVLIEISSDIMWVIAGITSARQFHFVPIKYVWCKNNKNWLLNTLSGVVIKWSNE